MSLHKFLKKIKVLQEVSNKNRTTKLGKGFFTAKRMNPYNPLSYITLVIMFLLGIIMFGVVGIWNEIDYKNPFKWY